MEPERSLSITWRVNSETETSAQGLPRWIQGHSFSMHFANRMVVGGFDPLPGFQGVSTHVLGRRIGMISEVLVADIITRYNQLGARVEELITTVTC
jgi:hypothetical protein